MTTKSSAWTETTVGSVAKIKHGYAFKGEFFSDHGGQIVVTPGNFHDEGGFKRKISEKFYVGPVEPSYVLDAGDVLVVMTEQKRGLLGSAGIIPVSGKYLHNQRLGRLVDIRRDVHAHFLYYVFNSKPARDQIQATANGAKVRHTSPSRISEVRFLLPPLGDQQKVASVLANYDELIENNLRRIEILEEMAQAIYREWFVNFRFPGHHGLSSLESLVDNLPQGWTRQSVSEIAAVNALSIKPATAPPTIKYVDIASVSEGNIGEIRDLRFDEAPGRARRKVNNGDTIWSCVRPNLRAYAYICDPDDNLIVSTGFAVLTPTHVPASFLYYATTTPEFVGYLVNRTRGAAYPAVSGKDFSEAEVMLPTDDVLNEFDRLVSPMLSLAHRLRRIGNNLAKTRDLLLPKLVYREIDVSGLDIDTSWLS